MLRLEFSYDLILFQYIQVTSVVREAYDDEQKCKGYLRVNDQIFKK